MPNACSNLNKEGFPSPDGLLPRQRTSSQTPHIGIKSDYHPDSKFHEANMGPHVGPMNLAIKEAPQCGGTKLQNNCRTSIYTNNKLIIRLWDWKLKTAQLMCIWCWVCRYMLWSIHDSKVHGANMGPTWGRQDPGGSHVGAVNLASWDAHEQHWFIVVAWGCSTSFSHCIRNNSHLSSMIYCCLTVH